MGTKKPDPEAAIASLTVPGDGWRPGRVCFRGGPRRPLEGLIAPDGSAWEAHEAPASPRALRDRALSLRASGYDLALVTVGGRRLLAERFRDNLKPWDGLDLGEWSDDLSGIPSQCVARGTSRGVRVALYLGWRDRDPWTGHVVLLGGRGGDELLYGFAYKPLKRCNTYITTHRALRERTTERFKTVQLFEWFMGKALLYLHPWSPNLLPVDRPDPARESRGLLDMLSSTYDPWIPEIELGKAKRVLAERADAWLDAHLDDEGAWTTVPGGTPFPKKET